ncbi:hypothetical protein Vadar_001382 [Vaccinium darrowii]|uniref:Uncharacterized protein n=1 Tax=Vaccinium darrowii TaxID=229202 RepID=A0ACB7XMQ7_9ERIC|nr:hypothetical protein Vadar_001382 [Vaccinium darrowii]
MAVATSVLSTRWKEFWTLVTCLDFDDKLMLQGRKSNRAALQTSFVGFIYRVLDRVSCLDKFRLKCCQSYDVSHVNAWVAAFIKYHVKELDLSVPLEHSTDHVLPQDLFSCGTLVVLKLGTKFILNVPASVCLPSLKILHLDSVELSDEDSIKRLLLGCPVLDELSMIKCVGKDVRVIHISAPLLTKLTYRSKGKESYFWRSIFLGIPADSDYKIVIDTPALLHLELFDYEAEVSLVKNLSHIVKADINIHSKAMTDLLLGISEVQYLHLKYNCPEAVHRIVTQMPTLHNLTSLVLGAGYVGSEWLSQLLVKSPCLESLVFKEGYHIEHNSDEEESDEDDDDEEEGDNKPLLWHLPRNIPSCLLLNLKIIKFEKFHGNDGDWKMVEYFLKNAEVLEKMMVQSDGTYGTYSDVAEDGLEMATKLLMLPRASRTCQIEFVFLRKDPEDDSYDLDDDRNDPDDDSNDPDDHSNDSDDDCW